MKIKEMIQWTLVMIGYCALAVGILVAVCTVY